MAVISTLDFESFPDIDAAGKRKIRRGKVWVSASKDPEHGLGEWSVVQVQFIAPKRWATKIETAKVEKWLRENKSREVENALLEAGGMRHEH